MPPSLSTAFQRMTWSMPWWMEWSEFCHSANVYVHCYSTKIPSFFGGNRWYNNDWYFGRWLSLSFIFRGRMFHCGSIMAQWSQFFGTRPSSFLYAITSPNSYQSVRFEDSYRISELCELVPFQFLIRTWPKAYISILIEFFIFFILILFLSIFNSWSNPYWFCDKTGNVGTLYNDWRPSKLGNLVPRFQHFLPTCVMLGSDRTKSYCNNQDCFLGMRIDASMVPFVLQIENVLRI